MEYQANSLSSVADQAKQYVSNQIELAELKALHKGSKAVANGVTEVVVILCGLMAFLFATVTLGFYLSDVLGNYTKGFGSVALIYLIIAVIVTLTKDKYIETFIINRIIKKYNSDEEETK